MRTIDRVLWAVGLAMLLATLLAGSTPAQAKPNILFLAIDDMNDWTGFLGGHPEAKTPNMDRLARAGVNFTNAHCPAPGCSPSRNALLYGVEPFRSGLYAFYDGELHDELRKRYVSLPQFLQERGYATFGAGKIHHAAKGAPEEWSDYHQPRRAHLQLDVAAGYQVDGKFKMSFCPTKNPLADHPDYQVATYGVEVLSKDHDAPFFLAVGMVKPHLPFVCPQRFFDLYPDPVRAPRIKPDDLDDIPRVGRSMAKLRDDRRFKKDLAWGRVRRAYLACISWTDYNVGRVLAALAAGPHAKNTIVVLWSDHGYALGEKQHFRKFALWEETTRVPFIIHDTREKNAAPGRTVKAGVSLINIYRTLADLAGLKVAPSVDGFSLVPQLLDPSAPVRWPSVCTWGRGNYAVRDAGYRYIRYFDGGEELYAHADDADEWTNLAGDPASAATKARLAAHLPKLQAPLVTDHVNAWSVPTSADRPAGRQGKPAAAGKRAKQPAKQPASTAGAVRSPSARPRGRRSRTSRR